MHAEVCPLCHGSGERLNRHGGCEGPCRACGGQCVVCVPDEPRPLIVLPPIVIQEPPKPGWYHEVTFGRIDRN